MEKVGVILQARTNSSRLPNKVLLNLPYDSCKSVLEEILLKAQNVDLVSEIILATTKNQCDNTIEDLAKNLNVKCFRGDEFDVLSRFYYSALNFKLDHIIRLTGDNPCIDYEIISFVLKKHLKDANDYTKTEGYPLGMNVEIISFSALKKSFLSSKDDYEKESVTLFVLNNPNLFKIGTITCPEAESKKLRLTLDTIEDYTLLCLIYDHFKDKSFLYKDILDFFEKKPWAKLINHKIIQKRQFKNIDEEIEQAIKVLNLQELYRAENLLKIKGGKCY